MILSFFWMKWEMEQWFLGVSPPSISFPLTWAPRYHLKNLGFFRRSLKTHFSLENKMSGWEWITVGWAQRRSDSRMEGRGKKLRFIESSVQCVFVRFFKYSIRGKDLHYRCLKRHSTHAMAFHSQHLSLCTRSHALFSTWDIAPSSHPPVSPPLVIPCLDHSHGSPTASSPIYRMLTAEPLYE